MPWTQARRSRRSRRRLRITTAIDAREDLRTSSRGCATTSALTPIDAPIVKAPITRGGRRTAPRSGPTRPDGLGRVLPEDEKKDHEGERHGRQPPVGDKRV